LSPEEKAQLSAQELVPIKAIDSGVIITPDNRAVQVIKVSAINLELMSHSELNQVFEEFEAFLKSVTFNMQIEMVSQPVDLKEYIHGQEQQLKKVDNPYRKQLLQGYIDYSKDMENSQQIIQRQRYIVIDEPIKDTTEHGYKQTLHELFEKTDSIKAGLKELDLTAEEVSNVEAIRLFHIFFDYSEAQSSPILGEFVPQIITGGKTDVV
jgi:type IV secretory pathway VirB4 component